ncbi:putative membrane protein [Synechococcus sp. A15-127]|nr:putative membrane protein [Synechococcus sp. A15-127]
MDWIDLSLDWSQLKLPVNTPIAMGVYLFPYFLEVILVML